jgi:hypothetical protein
MATTTSRRRTTQSIIKAWNAVKGLNYNDKLELVTILIESIKPEVAKADGTDDEEYSLRPFTMEELNARIDQAEAEIAAGLGIPDEEAWDDLEEELALQEKEEREMAEVI